ncbi:MAG TPA: hypothetical protein VFD01_22385 [Candidatus Dormibacteraeota bacterium]|nr:hypothetical protein [Candidatus Dormibacteraeota bacterium]
MTGLHVETELERSIVSDPRWGAGAEWGRPRPGHPEGKVEAHIREVLANLDRLRLDPAARRKLRLVALVHDTFKREVDPSRPRSGDNDHALIARRFLQRYTDDREALEITELHDEAYRSWAVGRRTGDWARAEARARWLLERLGPSRGLYLAFYRADNAAGDKLAEPLTWFESLVRRSAVSRSRVGSAGDG